MPTININLCDTVAMDSSQVVHVKESKTDQTGGDPGWYPRLSTERYWSFEDNPVLQKYFITPQKWSCTFLDFTVRTSSFRE